MATSEAASPGRATTQPVYRLTLAYDGTDFSGFQRQPGRRTVQEVLEKALGQVSGLPVKVAAAGRTDRGVHAAGQVVSFVATLSVPVGSLPAILNQLLPSDMAVQEATMAPPGFHARFSAEWKEYVYRFFCASQRSPLQERYAWRIPFALDEDLMRCLLPLLRACPDYRPFCQAGSQIARARPLLNVSLHSMADGWQLEARARSFLYKMMRRIVGLLVEVGHHRVSLHQAKAYLEGESSPMTVRVAPPQGLCLVRVGYPELDQGWGGSVYES